jgi:DNA-binding transcriptional LysR family regulator
MIDLNQIQIFERVAASGSFAAAARELGLPRSNVSRAVANLESALGTRLMHRTTRELALTPAGAALFGRAQYIMSELRATLDYMEELRGVPTGPLRVSAGIGLGVNVLSTYLPDFIKRYPYIELELRLESSRVDLLLEGVDVALRFGALPDSSLVARRLGTISRGIFAAPQYLKEMGQIAQPDDLQNHRMIGMPSADGRVHVLRMKKDDTVHSVELKPAVTVDDTITIHRLVRNGAGIGIVSTYLCEQDLAENRLIRVLPDWSVPPVPLSIVFPSRRELAPSVRAFAEFLREIGPQTPWADGNSLSAVPVNHS